ncbi:MAG: HAD family acid phosphatase [Parvularculaceae bacterium]
MRHSIAIMLAAAMLSACAHSPFGKPDAEPVPAAPLTAPNDGLNATLWMQGAVEYKANAEAVYALARLRLDEALKDPAWSAVPQMEPANFKKLPPAVILDVDETVLDNSAYQARLVSDDTEFSGPQWSAFVESRSSVPVPGALAFTQYAASKGVAVYYVTNRNSSGEAATFDNLKAFGFPVSKTPDTLLTQGEKKEWASRKESRFASVAAKHRVLLLIGDNFGDFTDAAYGDPAERMAAYEANADHWGRDWLALPNPSYGSWESSLYGRNYSLPAGERRTMKREALKPWTGETPE